jgi:hypothetical protein
VSKNISGGIINHVLETIQGLRTPALIFALLKMSNSEEKCPNAMR